MINIENARKDTCYDGVTPYKGEPGQVSEWALSVALNKFADGRDFTESELEEAITEAIILQTLNSLVDKGLAQMLCNESGEITFTIV